jgi:hypothetical protein
MASKKMCAALKRCDSASAKSLIGRMMIMSMMLINEIEVLETNFPPGAV